jgi:hypothetical protein
MKLHNEKLRLFVLALCSLSALVFGPEDGDGIFFRNVSKLLPATQRHVPEYNVVQELNNVICTGMFIKCP